MNLSQNPDNNLFIAFPDGSRLARLCRREKRFRVQVERGSERFWVHCNNSGSMLGLLRPGVEVLISPARNKNRKLAYTLELVRANPCWVGVNTSIPNRLLHWAWAQHLMPETADYEFYRGEVSAGDSRLDAFLSGPRGPLWIEAKNVTLVEDDVAYFPDAVSVRAQKHLRDLMVMARRGERCACFYLVQRTDAGCFAPADFIDEVFADLFWQALSEGVEVWPYQAILSPNGIELGPRLPLISTP